MYLFTEIFFFFWQSVKGIALFKEGVWLCLELLSAWRGKMYDFFESLGKDSLHAA